MRFWTLITGCVSVLAGGYTTYIGDGYPYTVTAMVLDSAGNSFLTGSRDLNPPGSTPTLGLDAFITKLDSSGQIVFTKTFGGKGSTQPVAIALDPSGNIYVAGNGASDLLISNPLPGTSPLISGSFILKLSPDGNTVLYLSYFDPVNAIATDAKGNLYVTGPGGYVTEISAAGDKFVYYTVLGGKTAVCPPNPPPMGRCPMGATTTGVSIAVDLAGSAYVAGNSDAVDLPVTPGAFATKGVGAFVAKISAGGNGIAYLTYLGSAYFYPGGASIPANTLNAIVVDNTGNAYLGGATGDPNFPATAGAYQTVYTPSSFTGIHGEPVTDAFVAKLSPDGGKLIWATYLGGTGADSAQSVAVDPVGNVWVSGTTTSPTFPNQGGTANGGDFLVKLNAAGSALAYAARYPNGTVSQVVNLDPTGLVHAAGTTGIVSSLPPDEPPALRVFGVADATGGPISGRIATWELISIYGVQIGPKTPVSATPDASGNLPTTLGGVQVIANGSDPWRLLYVSDSQINAVASSLAPGFGVSFGGKTSDAFRIVGVRGQPHVFGSADGYAAALNEDGSVNAQSNPAKPGSIVTIWATEAQNTGQLSLAPGHPCSVCYVEVYGAAVPGPFMAQAQVLYWDVLPGSVGSVAQINFRLPVQTTPGFWGWFSLGVGGEDYGEPFQVWYQH
jgi:uncharacterized protein (TIGR03437 family)